MKIEDWQVSDNISSMLLTYNISFKQRVKYHDKIIKLFMKAKSKEKK